MPRLLLRLALCLFAALPCLVFAADGALPVSGAYVRLAPPGVPVTGAFMVIHNNGKSDRKLLKAASPVARSVELHNHVNDNGVMKMRKVAGIEIKANAQAELKPGSYHVMLIGMKQAVQEGDVVPITLSFDDGSTQRVDAPVLRQAPAGAAPMPMEHGAMPH